MPKTDLTTTLTIIGLISALVLSWLAHWRGGKVVKISEQAGIASDKTAGIAQVIEAMKIHIAGLNDYITILIADKSVDKEDIRRLTKQRDALQKELNRMYHKYGENGNGNSQIGV